MSGIDLVNSTANANQILVAQASDPWAIQQEIEEKLPSFQNDAHFIEFDIRLTAAEIDCVNQLQIQKSTDFHNDGNLETLTSEVGDFIKTLASKNKEISKCTAEIIKKVADQLNFAFGSDSVSTTLRATEEDPIRYQKFVNRGQPLHAPFHADADNKGKYYAAFTLKGPSTFFYTGDYRDLKPDFEGRKQSFPGGIDPYGSDLEKTHLNEFRSKLVDSKFNDTNLIYQPVFGKGAIWLPGFQNGTIHAAPTPNSEERLFVLMTHMDKKQIAEESFDSFMEKIEKYGIERLYAQNHSI